MCVFNFLKFYILSDQLNANSPIHYAFPWRALTTQLTHYPPGCSLYDRSLYSLYGNMLNMNNAAAAAAAVGVSNASNLSSLSLNYLNSSPSSPSQVSPQSIASSHTIGETSPTSSVIPHSASNHHSTNGQYSGATAASLYGYRYHPYLSLPKV